MSGTLQASYALGYNLAIEYLADYEKTWMLDSFRQLDARVLQTQHRALSAWLFLEVCSSGGFDKPCLPTMYLEMFQTQQHG